MTSMQPMSEAHPSRAAGACWDPGQYHRFTDHRLRPALDLLARVPVGAASLVCDLGCGCSWSRHGGAEESRRNALVTGD